jgi:RHS repeat-associated protein
VSDVTTPYLYDGQNPAMISSNQLLAGTGLDEIYAQINSTGTTSYLRDGLNSTVADTNSSSATTANYFYSPSGDSASTGTPSTALQYTGRENDGATGLYYYRARYYSPQLGRFISEDPIGLRGGTNYYGYAGGNPIGNRDPDGTFFVEAGIGFVAGAAYGAISGLIEGKSAEEIGQVALQDALFGALTGLTDGGNLIAKVSINAALNAAGEVYNEQLDIWRTGCGSLNTTKIAFAVAGGALGDIGGNLAARALASRATEFSHFIQEASQYGLVDSIAGSNISGVISLVPSAITRAVSN